METKPFISRIETPWDMRASLLVFGYSLHFLINSFVGWTSQPSLVFGGLDNGMFEAFTTSRDIAFCLAFFVWFALAMLLPRRIVYGFPHRLTGFAFSLLIMVGASEPMVVNAPDVPVNALCGALLGIGLAGNLMMYQHVICMSKSPVDALCLIGGTAGGAVLFFLVSWLPSSVIKPLLILVAAPLCGAASFVAARVGNTRGGDENGDLAKVEAGHVGAGHAGAGHAEAGHVGAGDAPSSASVAPLKAGVVSLALPTVVIAVITLVMTTARCYYANVAGVDALMGSPLNMSYLLGALLALTVYRWTRFHIDMDIYARAYVPAIGLATIGLPFLGNAYGSVFTVALYALFTAASIDLILACNQTGRYYGIRPVALYSLAFGFVYMARLAMSPAFVWVSQLFIDIDRGSSIYALAFFTVSLLFAAYLFAVWYGGVQRKTSIYSWTTARGSKDAKGAALTQGSFERFVSQFDLTAREAEVAQLFVEGRSIPYIAARLGVSESTAKFHCRNLYAKCGVNGRQAFLDVYAAAAK